MEYIKDKKLLVRAIIASQFAPPFMFSGVAVALPAMGLELNAGAISLGLVETLFLAGHLSFLLPVGRLADASDKNTLYKLGLLGFGVSSILIGVLSSIPVILALRFLQGVTSAVFAATGPAILADIVPPEKRGRAFGSAVGAAYSGLTLGPICAGFLIDIWNWRAVFILGAITLLFVSMIIHFILPSLWRRPSTTVHIPSALLVIAAVLCLVAGSSMLRNGLIGYGCISVGLILAIIFIQLQRRLEQPLVNFKALMSNRVLRNALSVQTLLYMNAYGSTFMLSIYMQVSLGHSAKTSGKVLAIGTVLMTLTAPFAGILADRYSSNLISSLGIASVLATALMAMNLNEQSSLLFITLILSIQGLGFALFSTPNMTTIMNSVSSNTASMASALGAKSRSLGMVSSMLITTFLISLNIGNDPISQHPIRFISTMSTAFSILVALTAIALVICLLTRTQK